MSRRNQTLDYVKVEEYTPQFEARGYTCEVVFMTDSPIWIRKGEEIFMLPDNPDMLDAFIMGLDDLEQLEQEVLVTLPSIQDIVNAVNPIPWSEWLVDRCDVREQSETVTFYGYSNCNYIVYKGRVLQNFGYHGSDCFDALHSEHKRLESFARIAGFNRYMKKITK